MNYNLNQKGFSNVTLVVIVVAIIAVGGYFIFSKNSSTSPGTQPQQTAQQSDTSDWKTYRNEDFGFEAKYPNTWAVGLEGTDNITGKKVSISLMKPYKEGDAKVPSAAVQFFIQRNLNPNRLSIQEWYANELQKIKGEPHNPPTNTSVATIGGKPAILQEASSEVFGVGKHFLMTTNDTDILSITYHPEADFDQIYMTIISTLKFLH